MHLFPKRRKIEQTNNDFSIIMADNKPLPFHTKPPVEITMPYFGLQCDWDDILKRNKGKVWASIRRVNDELSSHVTLTNESPIVSSDSFLVPTSSTSRHMTLEDQVSRSKCSFLAPVAAFNNIHKSAVVSMDVTEGGLGVSVCNTTTSPEVKIWETETGTVRRSLDGHIADVHTCKFFPSGVVVLTAGADLQLKIWSAETGQSPVSLKGHVASISDTCIIERGRNIISVSKDGTARLWDCGRSSTLAVLTDCGATINACCILTPSTTDLKFHPPNHNDREIGTAGKLLLLAREDSKIQGVEIGGSRETIFTVPLQSAANTVVSTGPNSFAVGLQGGSIATFDLRFIVPPKIINSVTPTPILSLMSHPRSPSSKPSSDESQRFFWAARNDGTCLLVNPSGHSNLLQLSGPNYDPIYAIKNDGTFIFTACRDGLIRKYAINDVTKLCQ